MIDDKAMSSSYSLEMRAYSIKRLRPKHEIEDTRTNVVPVPQNQKFVHQGPDICEFQSIPKKRRIVPMYVLYNNDRTDL